MTERGTQRSRGSWATSTRAVTAREQTEGERREWAARQAAEAEQQAAQATTAEEREMWARRAARMRVEAQ